MNFRQIWSHCKQHSQKCPVFDTGVRWTPRPLRFQLRRSFVQLKTRQMRVLSSDKKGEFTEFHPPFTGFRLGSVVRISSRAEVSKRGTFLFFFCFVLVRVLNCKRSSHFYNFMISAVQLHQAVTVSFYSGGPTFQVSSERQWTVCRPTDFWATNLAQFVPRIADNN